MSYATLSRRARRFHLERRSAILVGAVLFLTLFGLEIALLPLGLRTPVVSRPAGSAIDPRLIVHASTAPVAAVLPGGLRLAGTVYPTMPGPNTVRVVVSGPSAGRSLKGRVELIATMSGMAMRPARATLVPRHGAYSGVLTLPMFGRYVARIDVVTPVGRIAGKMVIDIPLAR